MSASEWQPIETAPEDTEILLWWPDNNQNTVVHAYPPMGRFDNGCPYWMDYNGEYRVTGTHWMPLPNPPA